ncbi:MAG TPA: hypothetical protein PL048_03070 [Leptospiraceae bacterium]|nr:hypothetical protein [Leptospiraceae bacterium]HMY68755.1 hypothetical protein [Leptospiraceae bacterium]HMZ57729.1 hypothetical protein [Leptospiraceae bacterium]HNF13518.1 hypothetical protein [Leptospiraceae bacterium]HNF25785.1 hypothetical protein [Leptospiraceae bacterium]
MKQTAYTIFITALVLISDCASESETRRERKSDRNYYTGKTYCINCSKAEQNEIKKDFNKFISSPSSSSPVPPYAGGTPQERSLRNLNNSNGSGSGSKGGGINLPVNFDEK